MGELLKTGQTVYTTSSKLPCTVQQFLGGGGQGEVYQANLSGQAIALKWYFPHYLKNDPFLRDRIEAAIQLGPPSDRFLWIQELVTAPDIDGFGYIMPLRDIRFKGIIDLMKSRITPSFRSLSTAGFELADSFFQLHCRGLCYRDISFGNVFFNPDTGSVLICDNDNVDVDDGQGVGGVLGTPRFMAPEIVRGDTSPNTQTDLFSLAVLLFYIFMVHHPLEGRKEAEIRCFDLPAMIKLYGTAPIFIFDPNDISNRPIPGYQDNAEIYWNIYPEFLQKLFTKAFTNGLHNPTSGRVQETEWRTAMIQLRDSIVFCPDCGEQNFYDFGFLKVTGNLKPCWNCRSEILPPARIRLGRQTIMLNHDAKLFPHHVDNEKPFDFSEAIAAITQHPTNRNIWGLKNLSCRKWVATTPEGAVKDVEPGQSTRLANGTKINFGTSEGEICQD